MISETMPSEQTILEERIAGYWNNVLDFLESKPFIIILVFLIVILLIVVLRKRLRIVSVIPFEVTWIKKSNSIARLITDTPAPAPKNKNKALPIELRSPDRHLNNGDRQRILIKCENREDAEELGRLWFHKLYESISPTYDYIGWVDYETKRNQQKYGDLTLAACFYSELWYLREEYEDPDIRYSKQMDFFKKPDKHSILFINILEYPEWIVRDLGRHNNLPGLSVILISDREIAGYDVYNPSMNGGVA